MIDHAKAQLIISGRTERCTVSSSNFQWRRSHRVDQEASDAGFQVDPFRTWTFSVYP
jgi:hypothetical protein